MGTLGKPGNFRDMWHDIVGEWQRGIRPLTPDSSPNSVSVLS